MFTDDGLMCKKHVFDCIQLPNIIKINKHTTIYHYLFRINGLNNINKQQLIYYAKHQLLDSMKICLNFYESVPLVIIGVDDELDSITFYIQFKIDDVKFNDINYILNNIQMIEYVRQNEQIISLTIY